MQVQNMNLKLNMKEINKILAKAHLKCNFFFKWYEETTHFCGNTSLWSCWKSSLCLHFSLMFNSLREKSSLLVFCKCGEPWAPSLDNRTYLSSGFVIPNSNFESTKIIYSPDTDINNGSWALSLICHAKVIIDTLTSLWIWYIDCNICQLSPREYTKNSDHEMIVIRRHRWTTSSGSLIHVTCAFHHEIWYIIFFFSSQQCKPKQSKRYKVFIDNCSTCILTQDPPNNENLKLKGSGPFT